MPITYALDPDVGLLRTVSTGDVGLAEVAAFVEQVQAESWFPVPTWVDVRGASTDIPTGEVRAIAALLRDVSPRLARVPIAVVVGSRVAFGLVRMVGLLVDDVLTIRPFHDDEAATAWLLRPQDSGMPFFEAP